MLFLHNDYAPLFAKLDELLGRLGCIPCTRWRNSYGLTFAGASGRGGQMRATGLVRFKTVTSSPCATKARTALKSLWI